MPEGFKYRCSICDEVVEAGAAMTLHTDKHRAESGWLGHLTWTRVDPEAGEPDDG